MNPNPTFCKCGKPWEHPCKCPERILERFSDTLKNSVFYFNDFEAWMVIEFGSYNYQLGDSVLNIVGVIELGCDMYQTPYEV